MLSDGPIPRFLHGLIEYGAAALFLAAPFLFGFDSGAAVAVSLIAGVVVLFLAAATEGPTSLINYVPLAAHVVLDYVLAILLIAMPFIAGFSDETAPTVFFVAIGALHLLITIGTRFKKEPKEPRRRDRRPARTEPVAETAASPADAPPAAADARPRRERPADDWMEPRPGEAPDDSAKPPR
jgi:VIT1/CCC1 family predicted Fe2+/Mn2+ transporter